MTRKKALTTTITFSRSESLKTESRNSFRGTKNFHHVYPPPIFVMSQEKFLSLRESLSHTKVTYKARRDALIIFPETEESHTHVVDLLKKKQLVYQTFPLKSSKAFRVKINNLSQSIPEERVKKELENMGYRVRRVGVAKETDTGKLLPAFFVELEPGEGSSRVLQIHRLMDTRVTVEECEEIELPQCTKCQDYGHEPEACTVEARCAKCAGPHLSWQCRRGRMATPICALCGGPHPATYKGCIVYKNRVREVKGLPASKDPLSRAPLMNFLLSPSDPIKSIKPSKESLPAALAEGVRQKNEERDTDSDLWSTSSGIQTMKGMENTKPPDYWEVMQQTVLDQTKFGMPQLRSSFRAKKGADEQVGLKPPQVMPKPYLKPRTAAEITSMGDVAGLNPAQVTTNPEMRSHSISSEITPIDDLGEVKPQVMPKPHLRPSTKPTEISIFDELYAAKPPHLPKPYLKSRIVSTDITPIDKLHGAKPPQETPKPYLKYTTVSIHKTPLGEQYGAKPPPVMPKPYLKPSTVSTNITPIGYPAGTKPAHVIPKPQVKPKSISSRIGRLIELFQSKKTSGDAKTTAGHK